MNFLLRLLPSTLLGRVFSLYVACLVIFVGSGLSLFYKYQFSQYVEEELVSAEMMMNVAAQSVADSAVIGDYDTIAKTLDRVMSRSRFSVVEFIDSRGSVLKAVNRSSAAHAPPQWLNALVQEQLFDVNRNIVVGGKDYGVLRVSFASDQVAGELWGLALMALALSLSSLAGGMVVIWIPLKRWLGNFDRVRAHEQEILSGALDVSALLDRDAPMEIRRTFDILSRAAGRLLAQREEATITLNAITDGVVTIDDQKRVIYCNPAAEQMFGALGGSLVGRDIPKLFPSIFKEGGVVGDWQVRRIEIAGGSDKKAILDTTLSSIYSITGLITGYVLTFRDVTQQHTLDQQLRAELKKRRRALESLQQVLDTFDSHKVSATVPRDADDLEFLTQRIAALVNEREVGRRALDNQKFALDQHAIVSISDLSGNITYANDRFCKISGYEREELLGANHRIVKSNFHSPEFFRALWETISQGHVWHGEICNRSKYGEHYWVDATVVPLLDKAGLPEQYIAIRTDISERKVVELQLEEQLRFVEILLETIPTAIYMKDTGGRYLRFNRAFEELFGIERAQWIGCNVFDLVLGNAAAAMYAKDQDLFLNGQDQTYQESFTNRQTGKLIEGFYRKAALTNSDGQITGLVGTILDITERNRLDLELRQAKRNAEQASQAKSEFLANMSHEIRTPMNGVIGMTDLVLETSLSAVQHEYLTIVKNSAQALMVILNDILDFSKIEAGKLNIESVEFSPTVILTETLKTIRARAEKKGLVLICELATDLPETVLGDPGRIRQVLNNLCDNAIKFTSRGSVTVALHCKSAGIDRVEFELSVSDTGIGIPEEKQKGIFEAFTQADASTTRQFGGTGLGLTISARLVELMGGRIWVESARGMGSVFRFTLLVHRVASVAAKDASRQAIGLTSPAVKPGNQAPTLRILLVEDHPVNQLLATKLLEGWGHVVVLAQNGREAVELFADQAWDVVLMDMQMPVMGGLEATQLIRAGEPAGQHTPIIAMTANAMETDRQACLNAGMDEHLAKPFNSAKLQSTIIGVLNRFPRSADLGRKQRS